MNNSSIKVLITGVSEYIGLHCVKHLLDNGYGVRGTVRSLTNEKKIAPIKALDKNGLLELVEADLGNSTGWKEAITDVDYILHVASPFPPMGTMDDQVVKTAVDGVLNVFKAAAHESSKVKRIVLTSSVTAIMSGHEYDENKVYTESDWTNLKGDGLKSYDQSKTLAEQTAWDFCKENKGHRYELAVVNPSFVIGPMLSDAQGTSSKLVKDFLTGQFPMVPHVHMPTIDVRDVAKGHLAAMIQPDAAGHRHILTVQPSYWLTAMADDLEQEFSPLGYAISTRRAPKILIKIFSLFREEAREVAPVLDHLVQLDTYRMQHVLGISHPISQNQSLIEMGHSLIEQEIVERCEKYKKPTSNDQRF